MLQMIQMHLEPDEALFASIQVEARHDSGGEEAVEEYEMALTDRRLVLVREADGGRSTHRCLDASIPHRYLAAARLEKTNSDVTLVVRLTTGAAQRFWVRPSDAHTAAALADRLAALLPGAPVDCFAEMQPEAVLAGNGVHAAPAQEPSYYMQISPGPVEGACPRCSEPNRSNAVFCSACGETL
jgi:hypothetical protein